MQFTRPVTSVSVPPVSDSYIAPSVSIDIGSHITTPAQISSVTFVSSVRKSSVTFASCVPKSSVIFASSVPISSLTFAFSIPISSVTISSSVPISSVSSAAVQTKTVTSTVNAQSSQPLIPVSLGTGQSYKQGVFQIAPNITYRLKFDNKINQAVNTVGRLNQLRVQP